MWSPWRGLFLILKDIDSAGAVKVKNVDYQMLTEMAPKRSASISATSGSIQSMHAPLSRSGENNNNKKTSHPTAICRWQLCGRMPLSPSEPLRAWLSTQIDFYDRRRS
jgi:hypothetical protein